MKKGVIASATLFWLILGVIGILVTTGLINIQRDNFNELTIDSALLACPGPDGEGNVGKQLDEGNCPCNIDDSSEAGYKEKYFEVKEEIYEEGGAARALFTDEFLDEFDEDNPFRISESNYKQITSYIDLKTSSQNTGDITIMFTDGLEKHTTTTGTRPTLLSLCPDLGNDANDDCDTKEFRESWLVRGDSTVARCYMPDDECNDWIKEECLG